MADPSVDVKIGVDFGERDITYVAYRESDHGLRLLAHMTLLNDGERVITTFPTEDKARTQFEYYYRVFYRLFGNPSKTAWVRKSRKRTRRF